MMTRTRTTRWTHALLGTALAGTPATVAARGAPAEPAPGPAPLPGQAVKKPDEAAAPGPTPAPTASPAPAASPAPSAAPAASASASAEATAPEVPSGRRYSPRGSPPDRSKWIHRHAPERNIGEVGVFGGVWFPSHRLELFEPDNGLANDGWQRLALAAGEIGVRGGYYPLRFLGVEAEGAVMPTRTRNTDERATAWTLRAHLVGQLGFWSITPFVLVGTGVLGIAGDDPPDGLGSDQDVIIHFGGGAKFFVNDRIMLRLDIRDVVSNRRGVGEGLTSSPEILVGLSVVLGRKKEAKPDPREGDRDGDRVLDREDYCPDVFGVPPRGCPTVCLDDNDADGFSNPEDQCPEDPETRNGFEDDDGCPDEVPPELDQIAGVMEGINFDTDKDTIKAESQPILEKAIEVMQKFPDIRVLITGHTDARGGYRHNVELSQRRAESVKRHLVEHGVDAARLETRGVGPDEPIDTNETEQGRAKNRRIEFKIIE